MKIDLAIRYKVMSPDVLKAYNLLSLLCIVANYLNVNILILLTQMFLIDI